MCVGKSCELSSGGGSSDAWNHFAFNAGGIERSHLFTASPENEWIAPLQPNDIAAGSGFGNQAGVDLILRDNALFRTLSCPCRSFTGTGSKTQQQRIHQAIVQHQIGGPQNFLSAQRQQTRMPGAGTNKVNFTTGRHDSVLKRNADCEPASHLEITEIRSGQRKNRQTDPASMSDRV
jgi:hypothetical protein